MEAAFRHASRRIDRGASAIFGGFAGRLCARLALLLLIGRFFGAGPLGQLAQHAAAAEALGAVGAFGLRRSLQSFLAQDEAHGRPAAGRILEAAAVAAGATVAACALAWLGLRISGNPLQLHFGVIAASALGLAFIEVCVSATRFRHVMRWDVLRTLARPWAFLGFALAVHWLRGIWDWSSEGALLAAYLGSIGVTACVAGTGLLRVYGSELRGGPFATASGIRTIVRDGFPAALLDVAAFLYRRVDLLLLSLFVGPTVVGIYFMAQQIATVPEKIRYVFEPPLAPVLARLRVLPPTADEARHLRRISGTIWSLHLVLLPPLAVFAPQILAAFGSEFAVGATILVILLAGELSEGTSGPAELALVFRRPRSAAAIGVGALVLEAAMVATLARALGSAGAAIGFALAMSCLGAARLAATSLACGARVVDIGYPVSLLAAGASALALVALSRSDVGTETRIFFGVATVAAQAGVLFLAGVLHPSTLPRPVGGE